MSGPIVRTGTTPEFWKNWDRVFSGKPAESQEGDAKEMKRKSAKASGKKAAKKPAKKAAVKKK